MAPSPEITALPFGETIQSHISTIAGFSDACAAQRLQHLNRVPLSADHDPTLRFTNSTTSVMKSYLRGEQPLTENGVYLTQPAMGSQGIRYWLRDGHLGPYASYFTSCGALYPASSGARSMEAMMSIACDVWQIPSDDLVLQVYEADLSLAALSRNLGITAQQMPDVDLFRHSYGMETIMGKNMNLVANIGEGQTLVVGNLTLISDAEQPVAWEVSYDSTPTIAARTERAHAIATLPAAALIGGTAPMSTEQLVAADCVSVTAALVLEGFEPRSRGKEGVLRKFYKEYVRIMRDTYACTVNDVNDIAMQTAEADITIRRYMSPETTAAKVNLTTAQTTLDSWTKQLWKL